MTGRMFATRAATALAAALVLVTVTGGPASAHTVSGVAATNYRSEVVSVTPALAQARLRLLDLGRRVQLSYRGRDDLVVLGYQGEPYLRIGPDGVFENRRSPAVYQNRVSVGPASVTTLPPQADATAAPSWHRISRGHTATWRDQRTRWEGPDPPQVRQAPGLTQIVSTWTIALRHGDSAVAVEGRITWVPGPSPWPWLALALGLAGATASLGLLRRWAPGMGLAVALLVALDAVRSVGVAMNARGPALAVGVAVVLGGPLSVVAWIAGAWSIDALQQQRQDAVIGAGAVGLILGFYALFDAPSLYRSQLPTAFPLIFDRAAVAGTLGIGLGLVGAAVLVHRRTVRLGRPRGRGRPSPAKTRGRPPGRRSATRARSRSGAEPKGSARPVGRRQDNLPRRRCLAAPAA